MQRQSMTRSAKGGKGNVLFKKKKRGSHKDLFSS